MAFDGNGNWISDFSAVADRDANIKILASRFDNIFIADIATSFENCLTKDGQVKTQTNFNANNYRVINVADPVNDKDAVNKEYLESHTVENIFKALYPVGSLYIGTQNTCPLESLISGSTWELVAQNRALWGGDGTNGNTTINAGLPNITGVFNTLGNHGADIFNEVSPNGCFKLNTADKIGWSMDVSHDDYGKYAGIIFDASNNNSIYGSSSTVQPPAYRVNVWRRTA